MILNRKKILKGYTQSTYADIRKRRAVENAIICSFMLDMTLKSDEIEKLSNYYAYWKIKLL